MLMRALVCTLVGGLFACSGGDAGTPDASSPGAADAGACLLFCEARQDHIRRCGPRALIAESLDECLRVQTAPERCPTTGTRGGWLGPCVDGPDAGAAPDVAADAPAPSAQPVRFVLTNRTGKPLYLQTSGFSSQGYWALSAGSAVTSLPVDNRCEICDCGGADCSVCGRAIAAVAAVADGATHEWTWDGRLWPVRPNGGPMGLACEEVAVVAPGPLVLRVTYSASSRLDTSAGADDMFIGPAQMVEQPFQYPPAGSVPITAR